MMYWIIYFFSNDGVFISDVTSSVIALLILLIKEMVQFPEISPFHFPTLTALQFPLWVLTPPPLKLYI